MQSALRIETKVLPGNKIEINLPADITSTLVGQIVEVIVLLPERPQLVRQNILEWIEQARSRGTFRTVEKSIAICKLKEIHGTAKSIRLCQSLYIDTYEQLLLSSVLQLISISQAVLREAARLRAIMPLLRTPDAIHIATATTSGCTQFLTNDQQLRVVTGLPVVILEEVLAS